MEHRIRIKSLTGNTFTETKEIDGETVMYVYNEDGELLDVLKEVKPESENKNIDH